jgi:ribosomal protein S12 methylthiotransferase accessory factor
MRYKKCKDSSPQETIKKIKNILKKLNIEVEKSSLRSTDSLYSMRLTVPSIGWGVNGKGTTKQFCEASAYGEFMERLQNLSFMDDFFVSDILFNTFSKKSYKKPFFNDSKSMDIKDILKTLPDLKSDMALSFYDSDKIFPKKESELINTWVKLNGSSKFDCIPFYSITKRKIVYLPIYILTELGHSNGLASGNTFEEAICQGLSEILERYAQEKILVNDLTPPQVPKSYINKMCPELINIICEIEKKGYFKVLVYDCSLGKNLPVISTVLVNQKEHEYSIKFGAHPQFAIALERCLTELAQGRKFDSSYPFTSWTKQKEDICKTHYNLSAMTRKNLGSIPNSFFYTKSSWKFVEWKNQENFSNKIGVKELINICLKLSQDVYIRDNGYLGFPAYRIYVPKISSIHGTDFLGKTAFDHKVSFDTIVNLHENADSLSVKKIKELIKFLSNDHKNTEREIKENVLLAGLYLELNDIKSALKELYKEVAPTDYLKCIIRELELRADGVLQEDRDYMLSLFFGKYAQKYVALNWRGKNILKNILFPFNLNSIDYKKKKQERIKAVFSLYNKIEKMMYKSDIKQESLKHLTDNL